MTKQVKVGFDKIPAPLIETFPELVDIQGLPLTDIAGNRLITSVITTLDSYNRRANAMSVVVNQETGSPAPIAEEFSDFSEVSVSLLGVPRAEEQLSLFSDVSSYGIDKDNWNFYTVAPNQEPYEWYNRQHPVFGKRAPAEFLEGTQEQALYFKSFPTQYTFPFGPTYTDGELTPNFYKYIRFIALGRWLYEIWQLADAQGREFARKNFLPPFVRIMTKDGDEIPIIGAKRGTPGIVNSWLRLGGGAAGFYNEQLYYEIEYRSSTENSTVQDAMDAIENWTVFYEKIRAGTESYPIFNVPPSPTQLPEQIVFDSTNAYAGNYDFIVGYCDPEYTRPGDSSENESIGILESKETFRYQPGRISGFTFGLRLRNNPGSTSDLIEWGAANPTDQYMFQVAGTQWSIVVRSTVQRPIRLVEDRYDLAPYSLYMSVDENGTPTKVLPPGKDNSVPMHELKIPRSKWNGDPLDGSGRSGYIIDFEKVTMYKIEYSWYGAIGAKFYAYVPVGAGEARWVRLHTMIIENQMEVPVLQNPDFKFRYMVYNKNTSNLFEPIYIYKYGASYYIDGGDEGTTTFTSLQSPTKPFNIKTPIVGIHPKNKIINQTGLDDNNNPYEGNINLKSAFPQTLSVFSSKDARIDVEEVNVSPDGQHGSKSISLLCTYNQNKRITFNIVDDNTGILLTNTSENTFDLLDVNSKIVGDGLYNIYANFDPTDDEFSKIFRRKNYELIESQLPVPFKTRLDNGSILTAQNSTRFDAEIQNYSSFVGDTTAIDSPEFKVHFLNPTDENIVNGRFSDFLLGFTTKKPQIPVGEEYLSFGNERVYTTVPPPGEEYFDYTKELYGEFTNRENGYELTTNAEAGENDFSGGFRLEQDDRIRNSELPAGNFTGVLSCLKGKIDIDTYAIDTIIELGVPDDSGGDYKIVFTTDAPPVNEIDLNVSGFGALNQQASFVFTTTPRIENVLGLPKNVIYVKNTNAGSPPNIDINAVLEIFVRQFTLSDDYKLTKSGSDDPRNVGPLIRILPFNDDPLYLFIGMRTGAQINNIIVEQINVEGSKTHIPQFLGTGIGFSVTQLSEQGVSDLLPPSSFVAQNRLSGIGYDTSSLNPIRDGKTIYSFYIPGGENEEIDLSNIFNFDRNKISIGLYNNRAIYFKATALPESPTNFGEMQFTITTREQ